MLARYGGDEVDRAGDGLLALFDGPSRAIRCARAIDAEGRSLGVRAHTGVHTGEVERTGRAVRGLAVHVAARIAECAERGEIMTSSTVRDLTAGSGLVFEDRGVHTLKGVPDPRRLFVVA